MAFMLTHLLDPTPTEIHVFLSRCTASPLYVMTEAGNWLVDGAEIKLRGAPRELAHHSIGYAGLSDLAEALFAAPVIP